MLWLVKNIPKRNAIILEVIICFIKNCMEKNETLYFNPLEPSVPILIDLIRFSKII